MNNKVYGFLFVVIALVGTLIWALLSGSLHVPISELIQGLITGENEKVLIIKDLRFPRIILAFLREQLYPFQVYCCKLFYGTH